MIQWKWMATACIVFAWLASAPVAHADDALTAAKEHYKTGLAAYQHGDYSAAVTELKEAYRLHPLAAMLINLGRTYRKMGQASAALDAFQHYLKDAPPQAKERPEAEAAVRELAAAAPADSPPASDDEVPGSKRVHDKGDKPEKADKAAEAQTPKPPTLPPPPHDAVAPAPAFDFEHNAVDAAPPETPLDIVVKMPVLKGVKVFVLYRASGDEKYTAVLMKRHGDRKVGRIPSEVVQGKAVQYYIEAHDAHDAVMRTIGTSDSPNIVMVDPSAKPQLFDENQATQSVASAGDEHLDEEEAPLLAKKNTPVASSGPSHFGKLFYLGVAMTVVGTGLFVGGMVGLSKARTDANTISEDAKNGDGTRGGAPYQFQDPTAPGGIDDASIQADGKHWNGVGIGLSVTGGLLAVGGIAVIVAERVAHKHDQESAPKRNGSASRHSDEAKAPSWMIAPSAGPHGAGVGFSATF